MLSNLEERLHAAGYDCQRHRNLGPAEAAIYAFKAAWWSGFPFDVSYYVFDLADRAIVDIVEVEGFESLSLFWSLSDRSRRAGPWYRGLLGSAVSITILYARAGFTERAIGYVAKPPMRRIGHPSVVLLARLGTSEIHTRRRIPLVGHLPFSRAIDEAKSILRAGACIDAA